MVSLLGLLRRSFQNEKEEHHVGFIMSLQANRKRAPGCPNFKWNLIPVTTAISFSGERYATWPDEISGFVNILRVFHEGLCEYTSVCMVTNIYPHINVLIECVMDFDLFLRNKRTKKKKNIKIKQI